MCRGKRPSGKTHHQTEQWLSEKNTKLVSRPSPLLFFTARLLQEEARVNLRRSEDSGRKQADGDNRDLPGTIQPMEKKDLMEKVGQQLGAISCGFREATTVEPTEMRSSQTGSVVSWEQLTLLGAGIKNQAFPVLGAI